VFWRREVAIGENVAQQSATQKETRMEQTLDDVTARWNLLEHSFYQRWTSGTLTHAELCDYVGQYAYVVRAVPGWLEQVRGGDSAEVARHAAEERSHIALWYRFGEALGLSSEEIRSAPANAATARLIQRGDELATRGEAAPVVWALEAQTPAVAGAKLIGLSAFYGIGPDTGGEYFALHQNMDIEHAAELRALCSDGSQAAAAAMSESLWDLLTSVEAAPLPA
jgi:pyrroloquinoline-quinone synthase